MNEQKKEFIDVKLNKLLSAIRENRKVTCNNNKPGTPHNGEADHNKFQNYTVPKSLFTSNYEHRFQAQKEIIKCQKGTISMQEKLIQQMQNEIVKQRNEITMLKYALNGKDANKSKISGPVEMKGEATERISSRSSTPSKLPNVLQGMKQREEERKKRWKIIKEQMELKEKQKLEAAAQEEIELKKKLVELKRQKHKEELEKKKAVVDRQRYEERLTENSLTFYRKFTLTLFFSEWLSQARETKERLIKATTIVNKHLLSIAVKNWKIATSNCLHIKLTSAENFYRCTLMRRCISGWHHYTQEIKLYDESVIRIYEKELMASAFRRWHIYCLKSQIEQEEKFQAAKTIYLRNIYKHYFKMWREVPRLSYEKREQEKRIREWHCSVQQILPDFQIQE